MTVRELVDRLGLEVVAGAASLDREIQGGYVSDMLSDVMAHAPQGGIWLTVQVHQNVTAVGVLKEMAGVVLVGGRRPNEDTVEKAEKEGLPLLVSPEDAFTLAGRLYELGLGRKPA
ncbi:MAG: serine kinase [Deltaproteobacteria bacterium]|nr:serine kinase [Deltaproteobacteria bacterium]